MIQDKQPAIDRLKQSLMLIQSRQPDFPLADVMLSRMIHFTHRSMEQMASDLLAPRGLLLSHWMVLAMLYGSADFRRRPQELSTAIGQSGPNTTKTTLFLINRGWLLRVPDPDNRRSCWMELSETGKTLVKDILPTMWSGYQQELSPLDEQERGQLAALLSKLLIGKKLPCSLEN